MDKFNLNLTDGKIVGLTIEDLKILKTQIDGILANLDSSIYESLKGKTNAMRDEILEKLTDEQLKEIARIEYAEPISGFNQGALQKSIWRELFKRTGYLGYKQLTGNPSTRQREYLKSIGIIWKYNKNH